MFPHRRRCFTLLLLPLLLLLLAAAALSLLHRERFLGSLTRNKGTTDGVLAHREGTIGSALAYYGFVRGISTFQPDGLSKHLVLPCTPLDDVAWLSALPVWLNVTPKVYHVPLTGVVPGAAPAPGVLRVPENKGNEAMTYLTYVIDHFERLPDLVLFTHASATSWHNNELHFFSTPLMLRELNYARVMRRGFANLRCTWEPGCPDWIRPIGAQNDTSKLEESLMAVAFGQIFGGDAPKSAPPVPQVLGAPCCAQFAVSRDRIRARPLAHYVAIRAWLLRTELPSSLSGRVFEHLWHYIFAAPDGNHTESIDCPAEHVCYCDGYGVCFGGEPAYRAHMALGRETVELEKHLKEPAAGRPGTGEKHDTGASALRQRVEAARTRLAVEIDSARLRGRDAQARHREVGDGEFSG